MVPQSHTAALPDYQATRRVSLLFPHLVRLLRRRMRPYPYHRATIGLLDIIDMLYSLKRCGVCTTWPCCSAIPGVSSTSASWLGKLSEGPWYLEKAGAPLMPGRADSCPMLVRSWTRRLRPNTSAA